MDERKEEKVESIFLNNIDSTSNEVAPKRNKKDFYRGLLIFFVAVAILMIIFGPAEGISMGIFIFIYIISKNSGIKFFALLLIIIYFIIGCAEIITR